MRKVKLDSVFRLGRMNYYNFYRASGLKGSSCQFYILRPLGFCLNSSIRLCRLQLQAPWHRVCRGSKERNNASLTPQTKILEGETSSDLFRFFLCRILECIMKMHLPFFFFFK